jgi:arsenite methyltransferase
MPPLGRDDNVTDPVAGAAPADLKACCADLYASDWVRLLIGDSLHPGGLALTRRLGTLLGLRKGERLLDVACGRGASALEIAGTFGSGVVGVDYGSESVRAATAAAAEAGLSRLVDFMVGDAEALPVQDGTVDAVLCECALGTFPNKDAAVGEFARVLTSSGRVGIADIVSSGPVPPELETLLARVACVADARPLDEYAKLLEKAGFRLTAAERHDEALTSMVDDIRGRLLGADLLVKLGKVALPGADLEQASLMARSAATAVREGRLGYVLITAVKAAP